MRQVKAMLKWLPLTLLLLWPIHASAQFGNSCSAGLCAPAKAAASSGCTQATTFLARTSGLSGTESSAYTTMICGMVTDGTFSLFDGLYVFATNTTTTASLNLISTSFTLTSHGTPTAFTADRGYTGDASTFYLDTGFNPNTAGGNWALNSAHIGGCDLSNRTTVQAWDMIGSSSGGPGPYAYIKPMSSFQIQFSLNDSSFPTASNSQAQGLWSISRTTSSADAIYLNGSAFSSPSATSVGIPSANVFIMSSNNSAGSPNSITGDQIAVAFFGGGITSAQATSIYGRVHTYLTAVGASGC